MLIGTIIVVLIASHLAAFLAGAKHAKLVEAEKSKLKADLNKIKEVV